ncbi:MAG: hypothetical protein Q8M03_16510 [Legionella sp.]|nr:hypothetical protein [Legionella sp.]
MSTLALPSASKPGPVFPARDILTDIDLCVWVSDAEPGDSLIYYRGHLSHDRAPMPRVYPDEPRWRLDWLAQRALFLNAHGWIDLVQRRRGPAVWDYVAVKRRAAPPASAMRAVVAALIKRAP